MTPEQKDPEFRATRKRVAIAGGEARAKKLSKARRKAIAKNAADARWEKYRALYDEGILGCGCCGRTIAAGNWCADCLEHVTHHGQQHMRTYLAQHGVDCPFQDDSINLFERP